MSLGITNNKLVCAKCGESSKIDEINVAETERPNWICPDCEDSLYQQDFINWIENRIKTSTSEDTTGNFVLRELVQNADDAFATMLVFRFTSDALYVYNNGIGFRSPKKGGPGQKDEPGDFDRISRVLSKPKQDEYYTTGNFGSGFQTVYKFTNYPEAHSSGKAFRFDPRIPEKKPLKEVIPSPYRDHPVYKGVVFKLPWRTKENAVQTLKAVKFFESSHPWNRWEAPDRRRLFNEYCDFSHDAILCCQHLRTIRFLFEDGDIDGYQVQRDFDLDFIDNDGKVVTIIEGPGTGGLIEDEFTFKEPEMHTYRYLVGSDLIMDPTRGDNGALVLMVKGTGNSDDDNDHDIVEYLKIEDCPPQVRNDFTVFDKFLKDRNSKKKNDIHILMPLYNLNERRKRLGKKSLVYSVIPLPRMSNNHFTFSAHLYPKESREGIEPHVESNKKEWVENILESGVRLFARTYKKYVEIISEMDGPTNDEKQDMVLTCLPDPDIPGWLGIPIDHSHELQVRNRDMFDVVFSLPIIWNLGKWHSPCIRRWDPIEKKMDKESWILYPRNDRETWILDYMGFATPPISVQEHHRVKDVAVLWNKLIMETKVDDSTLMYHYGVDKDAYITSFFAKNCDPYDGLLHYRSGKITPEFVRKMIEHCILDNNATDTTKMLKVVPNKEGYLVKLKDLRKVPEGFDELHDVIQDKFSPHPDVLDLIRDRIEREIEPKDLVKGMIDNSHWLKRDLKKLKHCYSWLAKHNLRDGYSGYNIILDSNGDLSASKDLYWVPTDHYDVVLGLILEEGAPIKLVNSEVMDNQYIILGLGVRMYDYPEAIREFRHRISGKDNLHRSRQLVMIRGIVQGLSEAQWKEDFDQDLPVLPVDGVLRSCKESCLGWTGDPEVDMFIGSVDLDVQKNIAGDERILKALAERGCVNIGKSPQELVARIINVLDSFASKLEQRNGSAIIDDASLRIVTKCIEKMSVSGGLKIDSGQDKRFIPVSYRGKSVLWRATDFGNKAARLENYQKEWPWIRTEKYFDDGAKLVWENIPFLELAPGYDDLTKDIRIIFQIEKLISDAGVPRGLTLYFLAPKGGRGLFSNNGLEELIDQRITPEETFQIKKCLLRYIRHYATKPEPGMDIHLAECLYGTNKIWRTPGSFVLGISGDQIIPNTYRLHDDFESDSEWTIDELLGMGVKDRVHFSEVVKAIMALKKKWPDGSEMTTFLSIVGLVIRGDIGTRSDWQKIDDNGLFLNNDGKWFRASQVLIGSQKLKRLLGNLKTVQITIDALAPYTTGIPEERVIEGLQRIGFKQTPTIEMLMNSWQYHMKSGLEPPSGLFEELEDRTKDLIDSAFSPTELMYYTEGQWVLPKTITSDDISSMPSAVRERYHHVDAKAASWTLINWLLGEDGRMGPHKIGYSEILELLTELDGEKHEQVYSFFIGMRKDGNDITPDQRQLPIILFQGSRYCISKTIVAYPQREKPFGPLSSMSDWLILPRERIRGEFDALIEIGATDLNNLSNHKDISSFLKALELTCARNVPTTVMPDLVRILEILIAKDIRIEMSLKIIPVLEGGLMKVSDLQHALLPDEDSVWELFKDSEGVQFLFGERVRSTDMMIPNGIDGWALANGMRRFDEVYKSLNAPDINNSKRDTDFEGSLHNGIDRIIDLVEKEMDPKDRAMVSSTLTSLKGFKVYRSPSTTIRYSVPVTDDDGGHDIIKEKQSAASPFVLQKSSGNLFLGKQVDRVNDLILEMVDELFPNRMDDFYFIRALHDIITREGSQIEEVFLYGKCYEGPDIDKNLQLLDTWWKEKVQRMNKADLPTLDGDFWWRSIGKDENSTERVQVLKEGLFNDRKLMFKILSVATFFSSHVGRESIQKYVRHIESKGYSLDALYDMDEDDAIKKAIDDAIMPDDHVYDQVHPFLRSSMFDVFVLRRALKDDGMGMNILSILKDLMETGEPPEHFLRRGKAGGRPIMNGFNGMFTGQIYFIVREAVRLGLSEKWTDIAFHAPNQVRQMLWKLGLEIPNKNTEGFREIIARKMMKKLDDHDNLRDWYDIPFFIYFDEYCTDCTIGCAHPECNLKCMNKFRGQM